MVISLEESSSAKDLIDQLIPRVQKPDQESRKTKDNQERRFQETSRGPNAAALVLRTRATAHARHPVTRCLGLALTVADHLTPDFSVLTDNLSIFKPL